MESINIIEGLLTAAIKALPVEDFYKLRGEEPPKAGTDLTKATSEELVQALIDREAEDVLLNKIDISEHIDFDSCASDYGSDQVLDYVESEFSTDDILDRLDEDSVASWVAGTGRTVLNASLESITKELAQVLLQHAEEAE